MKLEVEKFKFTNMQGRTIVTFVQKDSESKDPFTITATPSGVSVKGVLQGEFQNMKPDLDSLAILLDKAWREHLALKPIIMTNSVMQ